jgi:hypothetical protein
LLKPVAPGPTLAAAHNTPISQDTNQATKKEFDHAKSIQDRS